MKKHITIALLMLISITIYAQGCSDAGFCTLQNTKEIDNFLTKKHSISISLGYGAGFENVKYINSNIEYGYSINDKLSFQTKLTYQNANGTLASNAGLGDVFITAGYRLSTTKKYDFRFLIGGKFPLNDSNSKNENGFSLPLDYQSSLGTVDLIFGSSMVYNKLWDFNLAFQIPVSNANNNQFNSANYTIANNFVPTTSFNRKSDALFRIGYTHKLTDSRIAFKPSLLSIYHFANDTYHDNLHTVYEIKGSNGLTLNGVLNTTFAFKDDSQLELTTAMPLKVREVRPDGLTRKFVINLSYKIKF